MVESDLLHVAIVVDDVNNKTVLVATLDYCGKIPPRGAVPQLDANTGLSAGGAKPSIGLARRVLADVVDAATMIAVVASVAQDHLVRTGGAITVVVAGAAQCT